MTTVQTCRPNLGEADPSAVTLWDDLVPVAPVAPASSYVDPGVCVHGQSRAVACRHCERDSLRHGQLRQVGEVAETSRLANAQSRTPSELTSGRLLGIIERHGPVTDDTIHGHYVSRHGETASAQHLRTVRIALVRAGRVRALTDRTGRSRLGNPSKLWEAV